MRRLLQSERATLRSGISSLQAIFGLVKVMVFNPNPYWFGKIIGGETWHVVTNNPDRNLSLSDFTREDNGTFFVTSRNRIRYNTFRSRHQKNRDMHDTSVSRESRCLDQSLSPYKGFHGGSDSWEHHAE